MSATMIVGEAAARPALPEVRENLVEEAREARALAQLHCGATPGRPDCGWYHASLPTLRMLGVFDSPGCDDGFLLPAFSAEFARGARRVLVSGCADAAMFARVAACLGSARGPVELVVLDICRTPLELCRSYAASHGLEVRLEHGDILGFEAEPFDVVCTHSFIGFFDAAGREQLARRWWKLLRPGGCVVTSQRIRSGDAGIVRYGEAERESLAQDALRRAAAREAETGLSPAQVRELADAWTQGHFAHVIATEAELRAPFDGAGFVLDQFAPGPAPSANDRPGTPRTGAGSRWRIIARRPDARPSP
jgi:SAM-dependent methyltransferase